VSDAPDMEVIRDNLRREMERKGVKPTTLSLAVGRSKTLVKDLLSKTADVQVGTLIKLAGALDVSLDDLLTRPRVPIVGKIGAEVAWSSSTPERRSSRTQQSFGPQVLAVS
jgi:transcriptional regulator with XRE-family HTH domain